ncbi:MAG: neuraminidase-like domain-containing protein [Nitrososphaeraceae archaeon]
MCKNSQENEKEEGEDEFRHDPQIFEAAPEHSSPATPVARVSPITSGHRVGSGTGNENLTKCYTDGCIENGDLHRYLEITLPNNCLRLHGRDALVAYLCGMNRVPLPWGGGDDNFARRPSDLSDLLLFDVEAGVCEKASRIENVISCIQTFIQRTRLGLEPGFSISPAFLSIGTSFC